MGQRPRAHVLPLQESGEHLRTQGRRRDDYLYQYRKFTKKSLDSYRLHAVAMEELGEGKLEYTGPLDDLYLNDYEKYIDYNIKDVELIVRMERKIHILDVPLTIAYSNLLMFSDPSSVIRTWDTIIANHLYDQQIAVPFRERVDGGMRGEVEGGYVKEPQIGFWRNVVSFDLNSLYPHIIRQYNISPETIAGRYFNATDSDVDALIEGGCPRIRKGPRGKTLRSARPAWSSLAKKRGSSGTAWEDVRRAQHSQESQDRDGQKA